ncbi:MAG: ABC transporter substrate-binding protein [Oscillospiraceae bacterium]|nr:ABC transporter substrate-binding protein [Oscillospiraceae bacterium]
MKTKILSLLLAVAMLLSLCACGGSGTETTTTTEEIAATDPTEAVVQAVTVTDMVGRQVEILPGSYKRVVCIGAGALRMFSYIGDVQLLCGVEDIDNVALPERPQMFDSVARPYLMANEQELTALPSCGVGGPMAQAAEAEKILACTPDLVISEFEDADKSTALQEQLGVPVITLSSGPDGVFDEIFWNSLKLLGQVLGQQERAEYLVSYIQDQAAQITELTANVAPEDQPKVYICGLGNWGTTNHLMTAQDYAPFKIANIQNAVQDLGLSGVQQIEEEKFVELGSDMDVIIVDAAAVKNITPLYAEDPGMFDTCKAWTEGEVYLQMAYNAYYTNYEIALANTWFIAKVVYPELFADVDMVEKTNEITAAFLNQLLAEQIFAYPSSFGGYQKINTNGFFG